MLKPRFCLHYQNLLDCILPVRLEEERYMITKAPPYFSYSLKHEGSNIFLTRKFIVREFNTNLPIPSFEQFTETQNFG